MAEQPHSNLETTFDDVETRDTTKVAALDIGSNSFHLVVARLVAGSVQILHRVKQKVRLADGLGADGVLSQEAIHRGLQTLTVIAESLQGFEPDSVRIVATYTLRKAKNARDFIKAASYIMPYPVEVISGTEEARLIYSGVAHTHHLEGRRLVVDIGGGSTEFIVGDGFEPKLLRSLQMGCVTYTQRFFKSGELKRKAFKKAITAAQQELELIDEKYLKLGWEQAIGTSGTTKNIVIVAQTLSDCIENQVSLNALESLIDKCVDAGHIDELSLTGMSDERKPVFAAGLAILTAIFRSLNLTELEYSPAALREGVLYEMEESLRHHDIRERTAQSLATRYDVDTEHAGMVLSTTMSLYDKVADSWKINKPELKSMLGWAALLHEVGLQINSRGVQRHSAYIIQNVDMPGFNQEQQNLLATLVRFQRKKIRPAEIPEFSQYSAEDISKLIAILRLGVLLNIKRQQGILPEIKVKANKQVLTVHFPQEWLEQKPLFSADLERESEQIQALELSLKYQ
ncbi:exopolyphosphatase [Aestuariibacter salexigens]|uniref:exopolyphosphatase n=1 Tax=Aestuariibacter salexigens TaxID=226010 RepID=UPI0003F7C873|nr:exopolyphosphatase [Aestuariibacter salexigens]